MAFELQIASPACTELEVVMMDWLGKLLDLPSAFLASSSGKGGGVIQVNIIIIIIILVPLLLATIVL